jgi:hypothetical protein
MATTQYKSPKTVPSVTAGKVQPCNRKKNWNPMEGMSLTSDDTVKTTGIKIRGTGAATKGVMARGPMA